MDSVNGCLRAPQIIGLSIIVASLAACQPNPAPRSCHLSFNNGVELADMPLAITPGQQGRGLQGVVNPAPGMVFTWQEPSEPAMWMKNTPSALDAAFVDQEGHVIHIAAMEPDSEELHYAPEPVIAVVEVPEGILKTQGIEVGSRIKETTCW